MIKPPIGSNIYPKYVRTLYSEVTQVTPPYSLFALATFSSALTSCVTLDKYFQFSEVQCSPCQMEMILILMYYCCC